MFYQRQASKRADWGYTVASFVTLFLAVIAARGGEPPRFDEATAYQRVSRVLDQRLDVDFDGLPLSEVARVLQKRFDLSVLVDRKGLNEVAISTETPVTLKLHGASGRSVLKYLLRPHGLDYFVRDEVVHITTPEIGDEHEIVVVYDVADLVDNERARRCPDDIDDLRALITATVSPTTWPDGTGPGPIRPFVAAGIRVLIIPQMSKVHDEIADLLDELRAVRHGDPPVQPVKRVGEGDKPRQSRAERNAAVNEILDAKLNVDFRAVPRNKAIATIANQAQLPLVIDRACLDDEDAAPEMAASVTLGGNGRTVRQALDDILRKSKLGWVIDRDMVLVTTREELGYRLETRVHDVADLPTYRTEGGQTAPDFDALIATITSTLAPQTWSDAGGCGSIMAFHQSGIQAVVVLHTAAQHEKIAALLAGLRKARGPLSPEAIQNLRPMPPPKPAPTGGGFF